jgi:putative N6-adenine-specific DNA methylase
MTRTVVLKARIESDLLTLSIDTSGRSVAQARIEASHRQGPTARNHGCPVPPSVRLHWAVKPVLDPMCGSGTFIIEAAEVALGLAPGSNRRFAFEHSGNVRRAGVGES